MFLSWTFVNLVLGTGTARARHTHMHWNSREFGILQLKKNSTLTVPFCSSISADMTLHTLEKRSVLVCMGTPLCNVIARAFCSSGERGAPGMAAPDLALCGLSGTAGKPPGLLCMSLACACAMLVGTLSCVLSAGCARRMSFGGFSRRWACFRILWVELAKHLSGST